MTPEALPAASPAFRWDRLTVSVALSFCLLVPAISAGVVLAELINQFSMGGTVAALHGSSFGIGLLLCGTFGVAVVSRVGRRTTIVLASAMIIIGVVMFVLGPAWPVTLAGTGVSGIGAATLVVVLPGIISDHHGANRGRAFAAVNAAPAVIGVTFSTLIGIALSAQVSWRPVYLAILVVIAVLLLAVGGRVRPPDAGAAADGPVTVSGNPAQVVRTLATREVLGPLRHVVLAVLTEFSVGVWAVTYLREVGGASSGAAPLLSVVFPLSMFSSRMRLHHFERLLGTATTSVSFLLAAVGTGVMCLGPSLPVRVVGLAIVGCFGGLLYPRAIDDFYRRAGAAADSVSLGAFAAIGQGAAVTVGPVILGAASDIVGLRWAMLFVTLVAAVGAVDRRPRRTSR